MLNTTNHQRNANQNPSEVSPHASLDGHYQKNKIISVVEDVEKLEPLLMGM